MRLVIIESPYAGAIKHNLMYARDCMRHSLSLGEAPLASHLLYPQFLDDNISEERQLGINAGLAWRKVAELAVFYTDKGWSDGMRAAKQIYDNEKFPYKVRALWQKS